MTRPILACLWLVLLLPLAYAQEHDEYQLRSITWLVDGITNPAAALTVSGIHGDEVWENPAELDLWKQDVQKRLMNTRLFEHVAISHTLHQTPEQETPQVDISIELTDSNNLFLLPRPKYDPGTGLELGLGLRDHNFLGSMQTLKLDLGIIAESIGQPDAPPVRAFFDLEALTTGTIAGLGWHLNLIQDYAIDRLLTNQSATMVGLGLDLPVRSLVFSIEGEQQFDFNKQTIQFYLEPSEGYADNTWYGASLIRLKASLPELEIGGPQALWRLAAGAAYSTGGLLSLTQPWPGFIVLDQSAQTGKLDWTGNFRHGSTIAIASKEIFNPATGMWFPDIMLEASLHQVLFPKLAFSARLYALHRIYDYSFEDGWLFRGVLDNALSARSLFSISLDGRAFVLSCMPSQWFHDERVSIFNFELQTSLFIDAGIGLGINGNHLYGSGNFATCLGIEVLVFPYAFKSAFLRLSIGKDLSSASGMIEPYLGLDLHY